MLVIAHAEIVEFLGRSNYRVGPPEGSLKSFFESPPIEERILGVGGFEGELRRVRFVVKIRVTRFSTRARCI